MAHHNSFADYLSSLPKDTIFRVWKYKKVFTPYEQEQQFVDQSQFEDIEAKFVIIDDVIDLPDGDILLRTHETGFEEYWIFYKFSEITLEMSRKDNEMEYEDY